MIRYFSTPVLKDYIRISVGRPSDTDKLVEVLAGIENTWKMLDDYVPQALIFDMDGVIADVSMSYRTAILETAKSYGAEITHSDINDAKAAGNANNDWILTQRLITNYFNKHGTGKAVPSLEEVTKKFEGMLLLAGNKQLLMFATDMYQGIPGVPGLREMEKLLVALEEFETFNLHVPLAIVTGRPRSDAVTFLKTHNIEHLFQYLVSSAFLYIYDFVWLWKVCMEDAPAKPSPEPVLMAMKKLGVERALMIGDTPDDIRAAVGAGIVGVGVSLFLLNTLLSLMWKDIVARW